MADEKHLVEMKGIHKSFGHVRAVENVDLILGRGEVLGLVGDNAAGKSTLMKVLTGFHNADAGTILIDGRSVDIRTPGDARRLGIEMIYQDFSLAPNLSVMDNIFLGREATGSILGLRFLNRRTMRASARAAMDVTHIRLESVNTMVTDLSGGQRQAVAIARATSFDARIIIMDEPTANLSVKAIEPLLDMVRKLRGQGIGIIFITHRIQDIFSTCDRVMVMRRGRCVGVASTSNTSIEETTSLITGTKETFSANMPYFLTSENSIPA